MKQTRRKHSAEVFFKGTSSTEEAFEKVRNELYAKISEMEMLCYWFKNG